MPATIDSVMRHWAAEKSDLVAISLPGDSVTYTELNAWVGRVAAFFATSGLAPGERLSIYAANSLEWCVAAFAAIRAGGIVTGINARMVAAEVSYLLGDYAPALLLADPESAARLAAIGPLTSKSGEPVAPPQWLGIDDIAARRHGASADIRLNLDQDAPAVIVTTSGSTARPKGVVYSHRSMIGYTAAALMEESAGVAHVKMLVVAPLSTSAGCVQMIQNMLQGGSSYIDSKFDADNTLALIAREGVTTFCGAPIFLQRIAACAAFAETDVSSIRIAHTGGAAVAPELLKAWADKGVLVRQIYGQTECGGNATANPRRYALSHPDKCGNGGLMGDIAIIDAAGNILPPGNPGQIILRGPGNMLGYWNNPEATAEAVVDGWLRTGDIGVIDDLGLLKMLDRMKDIIISGGLNISAAEVDRVIMQYPGIEEVATIAAPDPAFTETPLAIVYAAAPVSIPSLIAHCNQNLSGFKVPRYVILSEDPLPRLAGGKISKPALRELYLTRELPPRVR